MQSLVSISDRRRRLGTPWILALRRIARPSVGSARPVHLLSGVPGVRVPHVDASLHSRRLGLCRRHPLSDPPHAVAGTVPRVLYPEPVQHRRRRAARLGRMLAVRREPGSPRLAARFVGCDRTGSPPADSIGAAGVKAILDAWSPKSRADQLRYLSLSDNSDLGDLFPKEIFETSDAQAIIAAYRSFVRAGEKKALQPLNELKVLVVGHEAVGKTSLLRYLIQGKPRDPSEARTPGIIQQERIEIQGWSPEDCPVRLNVWDFGGQEMMRGTHRYFLTERSLYLLVLEDRRQDDRSIHDWMRTIRNQSGDSPVIVVINKSDEGKQDLRLDEEGLRETYKNIVAFLRTSCGRGRWAADSVQQLREQIVTMTLRDERLKNIRQPIPANWIQIKHLVGDLAKSRLVLTRNDFGGLCSEPGDRIEPIVDENEQRALLRLLHEVGTIVAHGLERDAPATRREVNLLDPNWLTGAIYRILDEARSVEQEGEFFRRQLAGWLDPDLYPPERHEFILDMMQDRKIGLCFPLATPHADEERYLVPEALPASRRFYGKWPEDSLRFRYTYM